MGSTKGVVHRYSVFPCLPRVPNNSHQCQNIDTEDQARMNFSLFSFRCRRLFVVTGLWGAKVPSHG
jgi:hypothetical protein